MYDNYDSWEYVISVISHIKLEYIDKSKIIERLENYRDYDSEILDRLYILKVININEYIKYMEKVIEINNDELKYNQMRIKKAKEQGENFDPHIFYCCCYNTL